MFFVQCPQCGAIVEVFGEEERKKAIPPWQETACGECDSTFEFHLEDIQSAPEVEGVL